MPSLTASIENKILLEAIGLHQQGRLDEAEVLYRRVLRANPNNPDALNNFGYIFLQKKEYELALEILTKAVLVNPKSTDFQINLSIAQKNLGQLDAAIKSLKLALKAEPDHPGANLNIASAYIEKGDFKIARKFIKRTLIKEPKNPAALMNLGVALIGMNNYSKAIEALTKADSITPNQPTILCNLGAALMSDNQLDKSLAILDRVIEIHPHFANAYVNRGNTLVALGRMGEAVKSFNRARELGIGNTKSLDQMVMASVEAGDYAGAAELLEIIVGRDPDDAEAMMALADASQAVGDIERSYELGRQVLIKNPDNIASYYLISTNKQATSNPDFLANLRRLEKKGVAEPLLQSKLGVALFRTLENMGEHGPAFAALKKGAGALFKLRESRRDNYDERLEKLRKNCTPQSLVTTVPSTPDRGPIFIVGMPRSGTTLVEQIISSHSQVFGAGELPFISLLDLERGNGLRVKKFSNQDYNRFAELDSEQLQALAQTYIDNVPDHAAPYFTDKMPGNFLHIGLIHKLFPNAPIINCKREPAEICFSCYKQSFVTGHTYSYDLTEMGRYYNYYEATMAHWHEVLPGRILDINYKDTVDDIAAQTQKLLAYCGLDWEDACLDFHKSKREVRTASVLQVRKPIYKSSLNSWKPYEKELDELFTALGSYAPKERLENKKSGN